MVSEPDVCPNIGVVPLYHWYEYVPLPPLSVAVRVVDCPCCIDVTSSTIVGVDSDGHIVILMGVELMASDGLEASSADNLIR